MPVRQPRERLNDRLSRWALGVVVLVGVWSSSGWSWSVLAATAGILLVVEIGIARSVSDEAACRSCLHLKRDHQGPCQECLRIRQRGEALGHAPCSRFAR